MRLRDSVRAAWVGYLESVEFTDHCRLTRKEAKEHREDLAGFLRLARDEGILSGAVSALGWDGIGQNFWLSRNRHGAGFFDSGAPNSDALQRLAHTFGGADLELANYDD